MSAGPAALLLLGFALATSCAGPADPPLATQPRVPAAAATARLPGTATTADDFRTACDRSKTKKVHAWPAVYRVEPTPTGAILHVDVREGTSAEVLEHLRCRQLALASDGFERHPDDPLALPGLEVSVYAEPYGTAIALAVDGAAAVADLQRRAATLVRAR